MGVLLDEMLMATTEIMSDGDSLIRSRDEILPHAGASPQNDGLSPS